MAMKKLSYPTIPFHNADKRYNKHHLGAQQKPINGKSNAQLRLSGYLMYENAFADGRSFHCWEIGKGLIN